MTENLTDKTYDRALTFFAGTINAPAEIAPEIIAEMVHGLSHDIAWIFERDSTQVLDDLKAKIAAGYLASAGGSAGALERNLT